MAPPGPSGIPLPSPPPPGPKRPSGPAGPALEASGFPAGESKCPSRIWRNSSGSRCFRRKTLIRGVGCSAKIISPPPPRGPGPPGLTAPGGAVPPGLAPVGRAPGFAGTPPVGVFSSPGRSTRGFSPGGADWSSARPPLVLQPNIAVTRMPARDRFQVCGKGFMFQSPLAKICGPVRAVELKAPARKTDGINTRARAKLKRFGDCQVRFSIRMRRWTRRPRPDRKPVPVIASHAI